MVADAELPAYDVVSAFGALHLSPAMANSATGFRAASVSGPSSGLPRLAHVFNLEAEALLTQVRSLRPVAQGFVDVRGAQPEEA